MNTLKKTAAGTLFGGALLVGGGLGLAHAAPPAPEAQIAGDGLVDITVTANGQQIGVIQDVTLANAVGLAASSCPMSMIDLPALTNLDVNGTPLTNPCNGMMGLSFSFSQNTQGGVSEGVPGQNGNLGASESAPGQNRDAEAVPPSATAPSTPPGQVG
ncbi:hypothetical protein [Mycolicibacterium sp.]|uniref:hypothetical protein n=1 Tax=Mycolicibacterium sp. TaxID=2320850 RepID=UPI0028AAEE44|nr:hypothetical protein [Mycolicibacterium sp.]